MGVAKSFTIVAKTSEVVTAAGADIPMKSLRIGAVILPAPTPVAPMARAIRNPARISTGASISHNRKELVDLDVLPQVWIFSHTKKYESRRPWSGDGPARGAPGGGGRGRRAGG